MTANKPRKPWRVILTQNGIQLVEVDHTSEAKAFEHVRMGLQSGADTAKVMQCVCGNFNWPHSGTEVGPNSGSRRVA